MEGIVAGAAVEFAAVVLGILVALWLNDWNEARKDRHQEINYLRSLRDDLESDRAALTQYIGFADGTASAAASLLRVVREEEEVTRASPETLLRQLKRAGMMYPFHPTSTTFQELSGGGGLRLISDRKVLRQAIDYYSAAALPSALVELAIRRIWHEYYDALVRAVDPALVPAISLDVFDSLRGRVQGRPEEDDLRSLPDVGVVSSTRTVESIRGNVELERALALVLDSAIVVRESMSDLLATAGRVSAALATSLPGGTGPRSATVH
jgi:hypothetical protein